MTRDVMSARDVLTARWSEIADKIVKLAEEFPADKFEFSPASDVRTFATQLRHVAFWNRYAAASLRGEKMDGSPNELARETYPTKAKIVSALRDSFAAVEKVLRDAEESPDTPVLDTIASYLGHNGEHYGQMVLYYRLNGLVPPASR